MTVRTNLQTRGRVVASATAVLVAAAALTGCAPGVEPDRDETGAITEAESEADVFSLRLGDCINDGDDSSDQVQTVEAVPCTEEHDNEVYAVFELPDGDFPGDDEVEAQADERCRQEFADFIGVPYEESTYDYFPMTPTEGSWDGGDREVLCLVYDSGLAKVTGTLEGIGG